MDFQNEREAFEEYIISKHKNRSPLILTQRIQHGFSENYIVQGVQDCWETWQAAKAQAVPEAQQALNDRLLVKSIREHVEVHISEISVNDLFDKGWLAAMKCIQNNIDMLEVQEPAND